MSIWFKKVTPEDLNNLYMKTMVDHLGIEFLEIGRIILRPGCL